MGKVFVHVHRKIKPVRPPALIDVTPQLEERRQIEADLQRMIEADRATRAAKRHVQRASAVDRPKKLMRVFIISPEFADGDRLRRYVTKHKRRQEIRDAFRSALDATFDYVDSLRAIYSYIPADLICGCCNNPYDLDSEEIGDGHLIVCTHCDPAEVECVNFVCSKCFKTMDILEIKQRVVHQLANRWPGCEPVLLE